MNEKFLRLGNLTGTITRVFLASDQMDTSTFRPAIEEKQMIHINFLKTLFHSWARF